MTKLIRDSFLIERFWSRQVWNN